VSVRLVESRWVPFTDTVMRWVPCRSPVFVTVAETFRVSPSRIGEFVESIVTEKFAGSRGSTNTEVESESFSLVTRAERESTSPSPIVVFQEKDTD
jgi:hypothetical protein